MKPNPIRPTLRWSSFKLLLALGLCLVSWGQASLFAQQVVVAVDGLKNTDGHLRLGFYENEESWKKQKSDFQIEVEKIGLVDGKLTFYLDTIPPGHYAMAVADDENDNGYIDWGWVLPKEGFGFSNYKVSALRKPRYKDFDFDLYPNSTVYLSVEMKYLR